MSIMEVHMNKYDKGLIISIVIIACLLYVPLWFYNQQMDKQDKQVVVEYKNEEILRVDLNKNANYTVKGDQGPVEIEIKDYSVRVERETSPYHICSVQGWVKTVNSPIICLPNGIVVTIEGKDSNVDAVIQ